MDFTYLKEKLSAHRLKVLLFCVLLGLLLVAFISGKSRVDLESIAVSANEQYIACFETGNGHKIHCFRSDGSMAFTYNIPVDISSGGHCTLWFEDDTLCALFYRTDKIVYFTTSGTIQKISMDATEESRSQFSSFSYRDHQYVFDGSEISVIYNKAGFLQYWLLGAERYLAVIPKTGEMNVVYSWTARKHLSEK